MIKTITIPAFKRPEALSILINSLKANDLEGWKLIFRIEPSSKTKDCIEVINHGLSQHDVLIHTNSKVQGVRKNTFDAVSSAFELGSSLNVYLEEDLVVSPDALNMADWYYHHCIEDLLCMNFIIRISGSSACFSNAQYPISLIKTRSFNSLGVVTTRFQWETYFKNNWCKRPENTLTYAGYQADGWDFAIYSLLLDNPNLYVIQPLYARANHVGGEGTYCTSDYQEASFSYVDLCNEKHENYRAISIHNISSSDKAFFILLDEMNTCLGTLKSLEASKNSALKADLHQLLKKKIQHKIISAKSIAEYQAFRNRVKSFLSRK